MRATHQCPPPSSAEPGMSSPHNEDSRISAGHAHRAINVRLSPYNGVHSHWSREAMWMNLGSESETVEFKRSTGEHKEALQSICAMLNKHGYGELFFGVKDDGNVVGQDVGDATLRQVASWIADKIEPAVFPTIERLETDDGTMYIRVEFSGAETPYSADGRSSPAWELRTT